MSLSTAFNGLLSFQQRVVLIERIEREPLGPFSISISPSNYSRQLAGPAEVTIEGREFVISKSVLDRVGFPKPKKNDKLTDPELGEYTITEVRDMIALGEIVGWRVRTS